MILLKDKYIGKRLLAKAGSKLTLISDHGSALIVECNGERFSVKTENVRHDNA